MALENESKTTNIEFYHKGDCLEQRIYKYPSPIPQIPRIGDKLHINFESFKVQEEHGETWKVIDLLFIMFHKKSELQTIQIYIDPYKLDSFHNV